MGTLGYKNNHYYDLFIYYMRSYFGDNRVKYLGSSYRKIWILPRCWIIFSFKLYNLKKLVCSTINKLHDLSLNRCKTGWILSFILVLLVRKEFKILIIKTVNSFRTKTDKIKR